MQVAGGRKEQIPAARVVACEITRSPTIRMPTSCTRKDASPMRWSAIGGRWKGKADLGAPVHPVADDLVLSEHGAVRSRRRDVSDPAAQRPQHALVFVIPLAWKPSQPSADLVQQATRWMADYKIPTADSWEPVGCWPPPSARRLWKRSGNSPPAPIREWRSLAEAQRWRGARGDGQPARTSSDWEQPVRQTRHVVAGRSVFVLGQALARHGEPAHAALAFLRSADSPSR